MEAAHEPTVTDASVEPDTGTSGVRQREPVPTLLDDRYEIQHLIGEGGMGVVYAARHTVLNTRLAIKVVRESDDDSVLERFRREARAASEIGHEGVIDVRDFGTLPDGRSYLVMERLDGRDLGSEMRAGPLDPIRIARIGAQIAAALGAAHTRGIVHRDLKPENVFLLDAEGAGQDRVKVVDFGIAKFADLADLSARPRTMAKKLTGVGQLIGTPAYMSPEQCLGGKIDGASDIYSLGVLMYEMSCGYTPFDAGSIWELIRMHIEAHPPSLQAAVPTLPAALVAVIERCLAKNASERPRSMAEVESALRAIGGLSEASVSSVPAPPTQPNALLARPSLASSAPARPASPAAYPKISLTPVQARRSSPVPSARRTSSAALVLSGVVAALLVAATAIGVALIARGATQSTAPSAEAAPGPRPASTSASTTSLTATSAAAREPAPTPRGALPAPLTPTSAEPQVEADAPPSARSGSAHPPTAHPATAHPATAHPSSTHAGTARPRAAAHDGAAPRRVETGDPEPEVAAPAPRPRHSVTDQMIDPWDQ